MLPNPYMNIPLALPPEHLLDALNTAVLFIGRDFSVLHINTATEMMLGTSRNKAVDQNIFEAFPCCQYIKKQLQMAMDTQQIYTERDLEIQLSKEHRITLDCVITPVSGDDIQSGYLVIELNQVDRRIRISREDYLLSQGEGTRDLLRGLAHEIKNPLGGIKGAAQLLASELPEDQYTEYTDVITYEVERLQNLVDRMLGPHQLPRLRALNVHEVLEKVRRLIQVESDRNIKISCDYDPSLPDLNADSDMLQQAFLNLARNALQAIQNQKEQNIIFRTRPERQFTIGHKTHRLMLKIEFIDNGPGIPPEMQETIFLPMVTSKANGTGLGLPIAQSLIQHHGGLIEYESYAGRTCFTVYLPLEDSHASH